MSLVVLSVMELQMLRKKGWFMAFQMGSAPSREALKGRDGRINETWHEGEDDGDQVLARRDPEVSDLFHRNLSSSMQTSKSQLDVVQSSLVQLLGEANAPRVPASTGQTAQHHPPARSRWSSDQAYKPCSAARRRKRECKGGVKPLCILSWCTTITGPREASSVLSHLKGTADSLTNPGQGPSLPPLPRFQGAHSRFSGQCCPQGSVLG